MKNTILFLLPLLFLLACQKKGDLPALPSYASLKLKSTAGDVSYVVSFGDSLLTENLSGNTAYSGYVVAGEAPLRIREAGNDTYLIDTVIRIERPGAEFTLLSMGAGSTPLFLSAESLQTTPPATGHRKYALFSADAVAPLSNRNLTVKYYDLGENGFVLLGEHTIQFKKISEYIELPDPTAGIFFLQVEDADTGEVLAAVDSYQHNMSMPTGMNNISMVRLYNAGNEFWTSLYGDPVLSRKL